MEEIKIFFNLCIIPHSEEPEHRKHDMVEVRTQTRGSRIYRSVGRVKFVSLGDMSDFMVRNIISELYEILHVLGR